MADISKITLPNGNTYNIDAVTIDGRSVDTSISKSNPTENIPTTTAVIDFVENQGFKRDDISIDQNILIVQKNVEENNGKSNTQTNNTRRLLTATSNREIVNNEINFLKYEGVMYDIAPKERGVTKEKLSTELLDTLSDLQIGNTNVVIESSAGNIFRNKDINTILTAKVYRSSKDITDTAISFTWIKKDKNGIIDEDWSRTTAGNVITISPADVLNKAIFECTVTLPDPEND